MRERQHPGMPRILSALAVSGALLRGLGELAALQRCRMREWLRVSARRARR